MKDIKIKLLKDKSYKFVCYLAKGEVREAKKMEDDSGRVQVEANEKGSCLWLTLGKKDFEVIKTKNKTVNLEQIREAFANYVFSEGCSCCRDIPAHEKHAKILAELLDVERYDDDSGCNFDKYRTKK